MNKLIIINEFLENTAGHYYEYDKAVSKLFREHGFDVKIYAKKTIEKDVADELNAIPFFSYNPKKRIRKIKVLGSLLYRIQLWLVMVRQIRTIIETHRRENAIFFVPNLFWYNVIPYTLSFRNSNSKVVLLYRLSVLEAIDIKQFFHKFILQIFTSTSYILSKNANIHFASDSEVISQQFEDKFGRDMHVLPIPHVSGIKDEPRVRNQVFQIYLPGNARIEKGIENITVALEIIDNKHREHSLRLKLILQIFGDKEKNVIDQCKFRLDKLACSKLYLSKLTSEEYLHYLLSADLILLPYLNKKGYKARTSGVLSETIGAGKPFITTTDSWMDIQAKKYDCGLSVSDTNPQELAEGILKMMFDYDTYERKSKNAKMSWLKYHCPNNYYQTFMQIFK